MMNGKIPKSWNDVTLKHLIELENIRNDKSIDAEPYAEITRNLLILSLFTGISFEKYETMPMSELKSDIEKIAFLNVLPDSEIKKKFKCGGYTWKVLFDVNEMSAQELVDHYELTKDGSKVIENANKLMALYCKPYKFGFKKNIDYKLKAEILQDAPISVLYPLVVFFCNLYPLLLEGIEDFLKVANQELKMKFEEINQSQAAAI